MPIQSSFPLGAVLRPRLLYKNRIPSRLLLKQKRGQPLRFLQQLTPLGCSCPTLRASNYLVFTSSRRIRKTLMPSLTGISSTRSPLDKISTIARSVFSSILKLILCNVLVCFNMVCNSGFKVRFGLLAFGMMPIAFIVLVCPRSWSAALGINARAKFYIILLSQRLFIPCLLQFAIL